MLRPYSYVVINIFGMINHGGNTKNKTVDFKGYLINDEYFRKKGDIQKRASSILNSHKLGEYLMGSDLEFVLMLLENHPESVEKKGVGVQCIKIIPHEKFGKNRSFGIVRFDDSETDFSFMKCITPPKPMQVFKHTCRREVETQIVGFKQEFFRGNANAKGLVRCPITDEFVDFPSAHVDHIPPKTFDWLVITFVQDNQVDVNNVEIGGLGDGAVVRFFANKNLSAQWRGFHHKNAQLIDNSSKNRIIATWQNANFN